MNNICMQRLKFHHRWNENRNTKPGRFLMLWTVERAWRLVRTAFSNHTIGDQNEKKQIIFAWERLVANFTIVTRRNETKNEDHVWCYKRFLIFASSLEPPFQITQSPTKMERNKQYLPASALTFRHFFHCFFGKHFSRPGPLFMLQTVFKD